MGNIGQDISYEELRKHHADAVRIIHEQRQKIEKLERRCSRLRELYESSLAVVRRYQDEREGFLSRVEGALLGIKGALDDD
jgi:predicted RNase H-like nuclease (RuvC/YqgF family)